MAVQVSERAAYMVVGSYVDAMDSSQRWLAASIKEVDPAKGVFVQFDGWSNKWNEWLSMRSSRLAPFRRHSRGYGGQQSVAIRDWVFTSEELDKAVQVLDKVVAGDLSSFQSAYDLTQWFRGHFFTLVDNLLGTDYDFEEEQKIAVFSFFEKALQFGVKWIQEMPGKYTAMYQNITNPEAYFGDMDCAYAEIWPELFLTLERLFGCNVRLMNFLRTSLPLSNIHLLSLPDSVPSLTDHFIAKFDALGGFSTLLQLLQTADP